MRLARIGFAVLALVASLSACATSRVAEKASQDLGCSGLRLFTYPVNQKLAREQADGTSYVYCCSTESSQCAEYFCPSDEKSGCSRL